MVIDVAGRLAKRQKGKAKKAWEAKKEEKEESLDATRDKEAKHLSAAELSKK